MSYLEGWKQVVKYQTCTSKSQIISRGIIQGENNSQLLFSLFINNIVKFIKVAKVILFADDVQIYVESETKNINNNIQIINDEIKDIINFSNKYGIDINPSKTKAIIISSKNNLKKLKYDELPKICVDNTSIEYVDEVRNLGYFLNRTATNSTHIDTIRRKVFGAINCIYPLKKTIPSNIKSIIVKTQVLPIFDYMDIIHHDFGVHGTGVERNKLVLLLNICIRFILDLKKSDHITPKRIELGLLKLYDRRTLHVANMSHKIIHQNAPGYLQDLVKINTRNTRTSTKLIVQKVENNFQKQSFFVGTPTLWNKLPNEIRTIENYIEFNNTLKAYLLENENKI